MTDGRQPTAGCLDPETLAAFIDGRLEPRERAAVEAHLAECADCYEGWMDAGAITQPAEPQEAAEEPRRQRLAWWVTGGLVAASVAAFILAPYVRPGDPVSVATDQLVAAVGTARFAEGQAEPALSVG